MQAGKEEAGYEATGSMSDATEDLIDLDGDTLPVINEDDVAEIGLEGLLSDDGGEEIGMSDIETEVDIDEVADLEPIIPETVPEMEPVVQGDREIALPDELTADDVDPIPSPVDEIIEISEFDQQYFDEESPNGADEGLPSVDEAEDDDFLELIDVDEADEDGSEFDDEVIHFDQPETESDSSELDDILSDPDHTELGTAASAGLLDSEESESLPGLIQEAGEITETDPESAPAFFESEPGEKDPDVEEEETGALAEGDEELAAFDDGDTGSAAIPAAISAAQIEAAVAHIIERDYAGKIESMVAGAIEKVVTLEIERIKARLFDEDQE